MEDDLDNALSGDPEPKEEPKQEAATGEEAAPPAEDNNALNDQEKAFMARANDEKRKRQEAQKRIEELEAQLAGKTETKREVSEDDYWDNPKEAIDKRLEEVETNLMGKMYGLSEELARERHTDFDEVNQYFLDEIAPKNPHIVDAARNQANPYEYIYKVAKSQKELAEVGDVNALKEKLKAEILAEMGAGKPPKPPGSLANERAAGGTPTEGGSESLEDLFGR